MCLLIHVRVHNVSMALITADTQTSVSLSEVRGKGKCKGHIRHILSKTLIPD